MYLGRVVGCVWATMKDPGLNGQRMLIVQPLRPDLGNTGKRLVCTDCTGAGAGEIVYYVRGKEASFPFLPQQTPTDTTVVGIVDSVHWTGTPKESKVAPPMAQSAPVASSKAARKR